MSGPMDPDRLAHLEHEESLMRVSMIPQSVLTVAQLIRELRGHAKHWEAEAASEAESGLATAMVLDGLCGDLERAQAEAKKFRDRCPVEASDVEAAGVTLARLIAWMSTRDHQLVTHYRIATTVCIADEINEWAERYSRPAFDILDEMAAMKDPS